MRATQFTYLKIMKIDIPFHSVGKRGRWKSKCLEDVVGKVSFRIIIVSHSVSLYWATYFSKALGIRDVLPIF